MQGIITGIGNKESKTNLIKPELDAVINDFIIGKNTILEGLVLNGNILSAGTCILCGYRGIIEENKGLDTTAYVYGKFTINFNEEIEDSFEIETSSTAKTSNVNPTEITQAGTYYLLLYQNGTLNPNLDTEHPYPKQAQYSVETKKVLDGAVIESGVVATTQPINDNSTKVATTEYVQNQIEKEMDKGSYVGNIVDSNNTVLSTYTLQRIAGYVFGELTIVDKPTGTMSGLLSTIPEGFRPAKTIYFNMLVKKVTNSASDYIYLLKCDTNGEIRVVFATTIGDLTTVDYTTKLTFGYKI